MHAAATGRHPDQNVDASADCDTYHVKNGMC